jgi:hypothetical protein
VTTGEQRGGIVYVLSNEAMPGLVKIGRTSGESVSRRVAELSRATGVPLPFKVEAAREVHDAILVERALHTAFYPDRVNPQREFFAIDAHRAVVLVNSYPGSDLTPETEAAVEREIERDEPGSVAAAKRYSGTRRPPQNFVEMGIPIGAELLHASTGETATVAEARKVIFRGELMSLTAARRLATGADYDVQPSGHWTYEGETVSQIYERTYPRTDD